MSRAHQVPAIAHIAKRLAESVGDNHHARVILSELNRIHGAAEALDRVRLNRSPLDTPEAHMKKVADMARKFDRETTAAINRMSTALREGTADLQRRVGDKVKLTPDRYEAEVRSVFRNMPDVDRLKFLAQLVDENRGPELAAIVKAPLSLTGIKEDIRSRFEEAIIAKHAPAEFDQLQSLGSVHSEALAVTNVASDFTKAITNPAELARIERGASEAADAGTAFDQALAQQ